MWHGARWHFAGSSMGFTDRTFSEIDERPITRPTAPGDGLAGVVVTEAMRREIAEAWRAMEIRLGRDGLDVQQRMRGALRAANLLPLPAPKEPTT
jgi:hypothetical protein